jgi:hypothetical protein
MNTLPTQRHLEEIKHEKSFIAQERVGAPNESSEFPSHGDEALFISLVVLLGSL